MRVDYTWLLGLAFLLALLSPSESRRVRVQQVEDEDDYYNDPQDDGTHRQVVLVSSDDYNGLYGQSGVSRNGQDNYIPVTRPSSSRASYKDTRAQTKEANKAPPVQTIRNYNKVNDDGSFTFGYEAADGSFKEETRGTDCVVRGKYGYVDPDGNKREFTYVSGNPCDPNAPKEEDSNERPDEASAEPENIPANYPTRPIRPIRPIATTPKPVSVYHNAYVAEEDDEEEQQEPQQVLRQQPIQQTRQRLVPVRPSYQEQQQPLIHRGRFVSSTTPAPVYREDTRPLTITPRPLTVTPIPSRPQPPATTYRPQVLQVAVTPRPALVYTTKQINTPSRTAYYPSSTPASIASRPGASALDFISEYQKFQTDNQITSTPTPVLRTTKPTPTHSTAQPNSNPVYSSELVFDPASGQYKTALYQTLPQTEGNFRLNHQIQPYVHNPAPQLVNYRQLQQQSPLYRQAAAAATPNRVSTQAAYQQQQAELQFQNSQQLFAQQQRARAQQHRAQPQPVRTEPQQFYYIQPQALQQNGLSTGQIDAFLRGHNIQF